MSANLALYYLLRVAAWFVPRVPLRLSYGVATIAGSCAYYLVPRARRAISANLARVLDRPSHGQDVRRAARRAFQNDAKNWVDTLRIGQATREDILRSIDIQGWEHLEEAAAAGKGVIVIGMHLGNYDFVGHYVVLRGHDLVIPVERMVPERLFTFLLRLRTSKGIQAVPLDRAPREMLRMLRSGGIVAIMGDRNLAGRGVEAEFFGAPATLPRAPLSLARHSGAPVILAVAARLPSDRFQGYVSALIPLPRSRDVEADEREGARRVAAAMEDVIRGHPDQWLMFTPVWRDGGSVGRPDTIGQHKEAAVG